MPGLDDSWLVARPSPFMIEDLYRSYFCGFRSSSGVADYIAGGAGVFTRESQRGFVPHYAIHNTAPEADLAEMLCMPAFSAPRLLVVLTGLSAGARYPSATSPRRRGSLGHLTRRAPGPPHPVGGPLATSPPSGGILCDFTPARGESSAPSPPSRESLRLHPHRGPSPPDPRRGPSPPDARRRPSPPDARRRPSPPDARRGVVRPPDARRGILRHPTPAGGSFGHPTPAGGSFGHPTPAAGSFGHPTPAAGSFGRPPPGDPSAT